MAKHAQSSDICQVRISDYCCQCISNSKHHYIDALTFGCAIDKTSELQQPENQCVLACCASCLIMKSNTLWKYLHVETASVVCTICYICYIIRYVTNNISTLNIVLWVASGGQGLVIFATWCAWITGNFLMFNGIRTSSYSENNIRKISAYSIEYLDCSIRFAKLSAMVNFMMTLVGIVILHDMRVPKNMIVMILINASFIWYLVILCISYSGACALLFVATSHMH